MTEMELFNILDKVGIDASSERFTQESFEYENPFYEFDEYMNKNYPNFNYVIDSGATKCVIIPKNEDYVLKIPFTGYEDWENQPCEEDEETGEWIYDEYYDPFVPFEDGDYCRIEADNYQFAIIEGLEEIFAETSFLGYVKGFPIYVQKKVTTFWQTDKKVKHTDEERTSLKKSYKPEDIERLPVDWCLDFIAAYGEEKFIDFLIFTIEYHINDLHGDNVAYRNGKPCLSDYSGYWS